jgi:hypothetical protein
MVSKQTMNVVIGILLVGLGAILTIGLLLSSSNENNQVPVNTAPASNVNVNQDAEWARNINFYTEIIDKDSKNYLNALYKLDYYTARAAIDNQTNNIDFEIKTSDSIQVSPELQSCKDEYRMALIDDFNALTLVKQGLSSLESGDSKSSDNTLILIKSKQASANKHYDNVTSLLQTYNSNHLGSELELNMLYHTDGSEETKTSEATAPVQTSTPVTKTLDDYEREPETPHASESNDDSENANTASTNSIESSTHSIFDYCTWQAQVTKKIGEYYKAPENKSYVVVTIKINNTGDQTYTTNPFSWHLKIGAMYYQPDSATYDSSLNHLSTDVGPGGKITTKIAYIIDGEPSISDMEMYYDGPGSDGTIYS